MATQSVQYNLNWKRYWILNSGMAFYAAGFAIEWSREGRLGVGVSDSCNRVNWVYEMHGEYSPG